MKTVCVVALCAIAHFTATGFCANSSFGSLVPTIKLNSQGEISTDSGLRVDPDGVARFQLDVPELDEMSAFPFKNLYVNIPGFQNGRQQNHYIKITTAGLHDIALPLPEYQGQVLFFDNNFNIKPLKSSFERLATPVAEFIIVLMFSQLTGGSFNDFKNGGYHAGIQAYAMLDSNVRMLNDFSEYLEVYHEYSPAEGNVLLMLLYGGLCFLIYKKPLDFSELTVDKAEVGFLFSGLSSATANSFDSVIAIPVAEYIYDSEGSERSPVSQLISQILKVQFLKPDFLNLFKTSTCPVHDFFLNKLAMKGATEQRMLFEMAGKTFGVLPVRIEEWGGSLLYAISLGAEGESGSLQLTYLDEYQKQLAYHSFYQMTQMTHESYCDMYNHHPETSYAEMSLRVMGDYLVGLTMTILFYGLATRDFQMINQGRLAKGIAMGFMVRSFGPGMMAFLMRSVNDELLLASLDYAPGIQHWFYQDARIVLHHRLQERDD